MATQPGSDGGSGNIYLDCSLQKYYPVVFVSSATQHSSPSTQRKSPTILRCCRGDEAPTGSWCSTTATSATNDPVPICTTWLPSGTAWAACVPSGCSSICAGSTTSSICAGSTTNPICGEYLRERLVVRKGGAVDHNDPEPRLHIRGGWNQCP